MRGKQTELYYIEDTQPMGEGKEEREGTKRDMCVCVWMRGKQTELYYIEETQPIVGTDRATPIDQ